MVKKKRVTPISAERGENFTTHSVYSLMKQYYHDPLSYLDNNYVIYLNFYTTHYDKPVINSDILDAYFSANREREKEKE